MTENEKIEEEVSEVSYKAKYENLVAKVRNLKEHARYLSHAFPEPDWPDSIDDRKKVIWYRNDVFEHGHAIGMLSACIQILDEASAE